MSGSIVAVPKKKRFNISRHYRSLIAYGALILLIIIYRSFSKVVFQPAMINSVINQGMPLVITSIAQTIIMITGGIDLSIGPIVTLTNCVAATQMQPGFLPTLAVCIGTLFVGAACGAFNGVLVAYGRLAPIIVTLATAAVYNGLALYVLPTPGGSVPAWYSHALTGSVVSGIPNSLVILLLVIVAVWWPLKSSRLGQWIYAVGSNEDSARMAGVNTTRTKLAAYTIAGALCALAGLFLAAQTQTGDATQGGTYTLNSVAAAVIGGTAFTGGVGGIAGSIAGAYVFAIIPNVLFAARVSPFMKEFLQGAVLVVTITLSSVPILRVKNKLQILR